MKTRLISWLCAIALICAGELRAANQTSVPAKYDIILNKDIVEVLKADGHYSILLKRLDEAKLTEMLRQKGSFTLFAPTDEAFRKLLSVTDMQQDQTQLIAILKNHIVTDHIYTAVEIPALQSITMMSGETMSVTLVNQKPRINGARIMQADMAAINGTVHGIDTVLMRSKDSILNGQNPPRIPEPGDFVSENP